MKLLYKTLFVCAAALAVLLPARAQAAEHVSVSAQDLRFYGDRYLMEGDGGVDVLLDHKYRITGNTFSMDMRLNRFVVAGNVHVSGPDTDLHGAGFADFFDPQRIYFIPLLEQPDRWTYENNDLAHPIKGRDMPGDPFFLPDVSDARVTVRSQHAEIEPMTYMKFSPARVLSLGVYLPLPDYVINYSNNPDFRQNSLAGAMADAPYDFAGGSHTLSTLHFRYDQTNHAYASFEQHYTARGGYAVGSINPLTQARKQYNIIGLGRIGSKDQAYGFFQAIAYQPNFSSPLELPAFGKLQLTHVLRQSFIELDLNQNYQSLLPQPSTFDKGGNIYYYGNTSHVWFPMHPFNGLLTWQGMDHPIGRIPLTLRLRSFFGWAKDNQYQYYSNGLTTFEGNAYNAINYHGVDALLYSRPIRLRENTYLTLSFDKSRQWFSLPHYQDSNYLTTSLSKTYGSRLALYGGYTVYNIGDYYGARQSEIYPPSFYVSPVTGQTYNGFSAFRGIATYRTLYASAVFAPTPDFTFNLLLKQNKDFPEPVPGILGNPPYQAIGDVRFRISAHAVVDVQRTYNFNYPGNAWSPNFQIQVLP